jgi:hypothetical protein
VELSNRMGYLNRCVAPASHDEGWEFLQGFGPWKMVEHAAAFLEMGPCPICGDYRRQNRLRRECYCAGCDHTGLDGQGVAFPGLPVGSCLNEEWVAEYPNEGNSHLPYVPDEELAGGVEAKPVKVRRGVARARRKAG